MPRKKGADGAEGAENTAVEGAEGEGAGGNKKKKIIIAAAVVIVLLGGGLAGAYFTGAFQIPITAIIVCMEMTGEHDLIFPMMIAALCAYVVARLIMPVSLYHALIERWSRRTGG